MSFKLQKSRCRGTDMFKSIFSNKMNPGPPNQLPAESRSDVEYDSCQLESTNCQQLRVDHGMCADTSR